MSSVAYNAILCRYNEIATKGKNRGVFEDKLIGSLRKAFIGLGPLHAEKAHGRIFFRCEEGGILPDNTMDILRRVVPTAFGLASVSPCILLDTDFEQVCAALDSAFPAYYEAYCASHPGDGPLSAAIRAHRVNKAFPVGSREMEIALASRLFTKFPRLHLDLDNPDIRVEVEARHHQCVVCFERIEGPGGLPTESSGRVLTLLSGGFDSPVAAFQMMRRGCAVDFIAFHSSPYTPPEYITKVTAIARRLNTFQRYGRLFCVNLLDVQKQIRDLCRSKYRTIHYRWLMMRIAEKIAGYFGDLALVTGDNLGQVASQTLENLSVVSEAVSTLVLRPLLTFDKLDIMDIARQIGTFDLSKEQVPDSCTVFAPDDPVTAAVLAAVKRDAETVDMEAAVQKCIEEAVVIHTSTGVETPLREILEKIGTRLKKE